MKQCPACSRTYSDNTLVFCLEDGTTLVSRPDPPETLRIEGSRPTDWPMPPANQPAARRSRWPIYALVAVLVVGLMLGVIGLGIVSYWRLSASSSNSNSEQSDSQSESWSSPSVSPTATPRTSASLVGVWRTNVTENGQATEITVTFLTEGDTRYLFKDARGRTSSDTGTWQYSEGVLFERFSNGAAGKSSIRWIDDNTVELTIIDNGVPAYAGLKRTYRRVR